MVANIVPPLSMGRGLYQARKPSVAEIIRTNDWLGPRLNVLATVQARLNSKYEGSIITIESARTARLEADAALVFQKNRRFEANDGGDPKAIAAAQAEVEQAKALQQDANEAAHDTSEDNAAHRSALNAATIKLNSMRPGTKLARAEVSLPSGRLDDIVEQQRSNIADLLAQRRKTETAPLTREEAEAILIEQASGLAKGPNISLTNRGASLIWPTLPINAQPTGGFGDQLGVADAAALIAWANFDVIEEHIKSLLDIKYASIPLALSAADRSRALQSIDAKLLVAERVEVEAMLLASQQGVDIPLRASVSPWAVLGCEPVVLAEDADEGGGWALIG